MAISLDKILNINIRDYVEARGLVGALNRSNYQLIGIHSDSSKIEEFAALVPDKAEAVVNYEIKFYGAGDAGIGSLRFDYRQNGIALIPKGENPRK